MSKVKILLVLFLLSSVMSLVACGSGASLEDTPWKLESYGKKGNLQTLIEDTEITAEFKSTDSKVVGSSGLNNYFGGYEITNDELTIKPPIGSTRMAGPEPIMEQEQEYLSLLETPENFKIEKGKLTISCSGNKILVFVAQ